MKTRQSCIRSVLSLALALLPAFASVVFAESRTEPPVTVVMRDQRVVDVIRDYEARGHIFSYSSALVSTRLVIRTEPPPGSPFERLDQALRQLDLALKASANGAWLVVRAPAQTVSNSRGISGRVTDATTGAPLAGVQVVINDQATLTDEEGRFTIADEAANSLIVWGDGYQTKTVSSDLSIGELLEIPLYPATQIDEVVVVSSRYALKGRDRTDKHTLDNNQLETIPSLGEDAVRAAIHIPGMASVGLSAKPHIRGGLQDELLVLFNNVELLEPFHLKDFQSVFSGLNPSLIKSIDVYTGGFPARYGDRMSGVMDIDTTDGHSGFGGELTISLLNTSATLFGSTGGGRGEWVVSGRRGNLDIVTKQINDTVGDPAYSDWYGQFLWEVDARTELDVGMIVYNDDIELRDFDTDGEIANSRYRNAYGWLAFHRSWSDIVDSSTLLSAGSIKHDRDGTLSDEDLDNGEAFVEDQREFRVFSLAHDMRFSWSEAMHLEAGARLNYQSGEYNYVGNIRQGVLAEFLGQPTIIERASRLRPQGTSGGAYASLRFQPTDWLTLEPGVRWDFQDYGQRSQSQWSPRFSAKFDIRKDGQFRASIGRFHQPEGIHELQVGDGIESYQRAQFADHLILGYSHTFGDTGFSARAEAFGKRFKRPKRRFENLFNSLVLLPELASDRIEVAPSKARAQGVEFTLRYERDEALDLWLSYTYSDVEDYIDGQWTPRVWDQGNTVSAGAIWQNEAWSLSGTLLWHSGWRTTTLPRFIPSDEPPQLARNRDRLAYYLSIDVRLSRTWNIGDQSFVLFAEVTNLTNRHNVGGVEYDVEETEAGDGFLLTSSDETLIPLVPSIGFQWRF